MSEHICEDLLPYVSRDKLTCDGARLGISVKPEDIRLIPTAENFYAWRILPEKRHLFKKGYLEETH